MSLEIYGRTKHLCLFFVCEQITTMVIFDVTETVLVKAHYLMSLNEIIWLRYRWNWALFTRYPFKHVSTAVICGITDFANVDNEFMQAQHGKASVGFRHAVRVSQGQRTGENFYIQHFCSSLHELNMMLRAELLYAIANVVL